MLEGMRVRLSSDGESIYFNEEYADNGSKMYGKASTSGIAMLGFDEYTADQLEAIAMWMRDSKGVMGGI